MACETVKYLESVYWTWDRFTFFFFQLNNYLIILLYYLYYVLLGKTNFSQRSKSCLFRLGPHICIYLHSFNNIANRKHHKQIISILIQQTFQLRLVVVKIIFEWNIKQTFHNLFLWMCLFITIHVVFIFIFELIIRWDWKS